MNMLVQLNSDFHGHTQLGCYPISASLNSTDNIIPEGISRCSGKASDRKKG